MAPNDLEARQSISTSQAALYCRQCMRISDCCLACGWGIFISAMIVTEAHLAHSKLIRNLVLPGSLGALLLCAGGGMVAACELGEFTANLRWSYDNNASARDLIIKGVDEGNIALIKQAYTFSQPPKNHGYMIGCRPRDILNIAESVIH